MGNRNENRSISIIGKIRTFKLGFSNPFHLFFEFIYQKPNWISND